MGKDLFFGIFNQLKSLLKSFSGGFQTFLG